MCELVRLEHFYKGGHKVPNVFHQPFSQPPPLYIEGALKLAVMGQNPCLSLPGDPAASRPTWPSNSYLPTSVPPVSLSPPVQPWGTKFTTKEFPRGLDQHRIDPVYQTDYALGLFEPSPLSHALGLAASPTTMSRGLTTNRARCKDLDG